jgi:hypothetical protein
MAGVARLVGVADELGVQLLVALKGDATRFLVVILKKWNRKTQIRHGIMYKKTGFTKFGVTLIFLFCQFFFKIQIWRLMSCKFHAEAFCCHSR